MLPTLRYAAGVVVAGIATTMCEVTKTVSNDCHVIPMDTYTWDVYQLTFDHTNPARCPIRIISQENIYVAGTWTDNGVPDFLTGQVVAVSQPDAEVKARHFIQFALDDGKWVGQVNLNYTAGTGYNRCLDIVTEEMTIYSNGQPVLNGQPKASVWVTYTYYGDVPHCDPEGGGGDNIVVRSSGA